MAVIEAVLVYRPGGYGEDLPPIPIGRTADPQVLRLLRDRLIEEALRQAERWEAIDAVVAAVHALSAERLVRLLDLLLPDEGPRPELRRVK